MKWEEVRKMYPNQFVLMKVLDYHTENDKRYIDDVAVVRPIPDNKEASKLLTTAEKGDLVYHTANEQAVVRIKEIRNYRGLV